MKLLVALLIVAMARAGHSADCLSTKIGVVSIGNKVNGKILSVGRSKINIINTATNLDGVDEDAVKSKAEAEIQAELEAKAMLAKSLGKKLVLSGAKVEFRCQKGNYAFVGVSLYSSEESAAAKMINQLEDAVSTTRAASQISPD